MTRRRIILAAVALLLAAFVMAVQRDTFVRRWCLPTPPPATRAAGPLDQVIEEFEVRGTPAEMFREVERRSGVRIRESEHWAAKSLPREPLPCTIRGAAVEQLLCRILYATEVLDDPFPIDADGFVLFQSEASNSIRPTIARVHAPDRALLQPDARPTKRWPWNHGVYDLIQKLERCTDYRSGSRLYRYDPVLRFGDKLIVVTTPRSHWLIDQILREEADALKAKLAQPAATLPAR